MKGELTGLLKKSVSVFVRGDHTADGESACKQKPPQECHSQQPPGGFFWIVTKADRHSKHGVPETVKGSMFILAAQPFHFEQHLPGAGVVSIFPQHFRE